MAPIQVTSELPEWENLVRQVNELYRMFPEITALRAAVASIDRQVGILQSDVGGLKTDMVEVRRRVERIEPFMFSQRQNNTMTLLVGLVGAILVAGAVILWSLR